jgi:hypothetical protein
VSLYDQLIQQEKVQIGILMGVDLFQIHTTERNKRKLVNSPIQEWL